MEQSNNNLNQLFDRAVEAIDVAKKLTTNDRKKLNKSTFCGPDRSFPVTDCKHVGTAKAYLGRSNFSKSTKKKIAACINRRAKQLGCTSKKKAKAGEHPKFIELSYEQKQLYSSEIFASTKQLVEESIANPGMSLDLDLVQIDEQE